MRVLESVGQYHDLWSWILASAPDHFRSFDEEPVDQGKALQDAFEQLRAGFRFARTKLKDDRLARVAQELIEMSFEAYSGGDTKRGAHTLQECEGFIWSKRKLRVKYAVEAELRAFGENILFAGIHISPYPYEGTRADLSHEQSLLLRVAEESFRAHQAARKDCQYFAWVITGLGVVHRISAEPKDDGHPSLVPIQKSFRGIYKQLKALGESNQMQCCVFMQAIGALGDGIVTYDLEQRGRPRVSARQLFKLSPAGVHGYDNMRFHLEDPQFFPEQSAEAQQAVQGPMSPPSAGTRP